jgi:parallel beta-helix repeat protein
MMKIAVIVSCLMMVMTGVLVAAMRQPEVRAFAGSTLYVGGGGSGNYSRIQDAIDNATDGDTVFVYDDASPYLENLMVDKSISMIGENKETTRIEGITNVTVVRLAADHILLQGFTIVIPTFPMPWIMGVYVSKTENWPYEQDVVIENITVSDVNIISHNSRTDGIGCLYCNNSTFVGNTVSNCYFGIHLFLSCNNIVSHNKVQQCQYGVYVENTWNPHYRLWFAHPTFGSNTIANNTIKGNEYGVLIDGDRTVSDKILDNNVTGNHDGIALGTTIKTEVARNNLISNVVDATIETAKLTFYPTCEWHDNYWGEPTGSRVRIRGNFYLVFFINGFGGETNFGMGISLGIFPIIIAFDRSPAQEPYPIN